ncbi:MAG: NADH-quinone oxidoreductase subunit M [Spirochaetota bacterium]|nr:NADH-quinone oxidoreductase subunit M [Spirochaetota bacterium]
MKFPLMTLVLFLPTLGAIILMFIPSDRLFKPSNRDKVLKTIAFIFSLITFLLSIPLLTKFGADSSFFDFVEGPYEWINPEYINTSYHLKIDGISVLLVILTTFLTPIILLGSWNSINVRLKEFVVCMLLMETGMIGAFVAWDLLLFYVFWELMLIPMYFIIGIWGSEKKIYAAVKFFIYTMVGSLFMFLAILYIYIQVGSFDLDIIYSSINTINLNISIFGIHLNVQHILFIAFALSFAIKVPMFPFHTWLPDAHVQAPTAGSVILAGVLLKMGTYGFIRFAIPFFPDAAIDFAPAISILAIIGIIYGAFMALAQSDIKKLIAYSSISHLGFVMLGLFAFSAINPGTISSVMSYQGVQGAIYQMIGHGLSTGALFLLVGMIYERRHTKEMKEFGGIAKVMPIYAVIFMITTLASIGLPGLNGFVGEFLILFGTFKANWIFGAFAATGVILGAVYMLILYQKVFFGECKNPKNLSLKDLSIREIIVVGPLVILMIIMGVVPNYFLDKIKITLDSFLR